MFKFPYTKNGKGYTFALIPIILENKEENIKSGYIAQIDSGAVFSVFHTDIADTLGIDLKHIKKQVLFRGVGEQSKDFIGKPYIINLMVYQKGISHKFESVIVFSDDINKDGYPLLGMGGFFNKFKKVIFDNERQKVILEP